MQNKFTFKARFARRCFPLAPSNVDCIIVIPPVACVAAVKEKSISMPLSFQLPFDARLIRFEAKKKTRSVLDDKE